MTPRNHLFAASVIAATVLAVVWLASHRDLRPAPTAPPKLTSAAGNVAASASRPSQGIATKLAPRLPARAANLALPNSNVPLDQAIPLLLEFAESGDTDAEVELSFRLSVCTKHALRASDEADRSDLDMIETDKTDDHFNDEQRAVRAANMHARVDQRAYDRKACGELPGDLRSNWLTWIDQAAQSGNTNAMLEYARLSTADYDSVNAIVTDVDTAIERRDKARAYLQEALQLGDLRSLSDLAYAYFESSGNTPSVYAADASQAYAYAYASTLAGVSRPGDLEWVMSKSAESLDARQLADAQAKGHAIYERCCKTH